MKVAPALTHRLAAVGLLVLAATAAPAADPIQPKYLPYVEFTTEDTSERIALKKAYNDAVLAYNQALYDYLVTLERHDRLVDIHNTSSDEAERKRARDQAQGFRTRLAELRRDVSTRASLVDQVGRRAAAAGISVTR